MKAEAPKAVSAQGLDFSRPLTTVDVVIFSVRDSTLRVLLVKRPTDPQEPFPGHWALPGGFVDVALDADLQSCAIRKLREKTGLDAAYLEQLGSWGSATRDPRDWSATHVYFSLIPSDEVGLHPGGNAIGLQWFDVVNDRVSVSLAFDHGALLKAAVGRLRAKVEYTSLPAFLMPNEFTLTELQKTYEAILSRELEKKAFRTRVLSADLLDPVPRLRSGSNRPAQLYRLRRKGQPYLFSRPFGSAHPSSSGS